MSCRLEYEQRDWTYNNCMFIFEDLGVTRSDMFTVFFVQTLVTWSIHFTSSASAVSLILHQESLFACLFLRIFSRQAKICLVTDSRSIN